MAEDERDTDRRIVEVEFNQQQEAILTRLREEGRYGHGDAEIIRGVFQEFLRQTQI